MVARLQPFKGPGDFIAMASQVLESRPDARFLIIGPDSSRSPGLRIQLESRIDELGLRNQIALAGPLSEEDLAATVSHSTLLVHPAHREGFGLVLVEAMALGTPVVAYAASGPRHILGHGGGTLVKVGDTRALADCVLAALHDSTLLELWRKQCLPVAQHFSLERMTVGYLSVMRPKC
jgi:glycosyltransferase involved in cell wall biosynthesis